MATPDPAQVYYQLQEAITKNKRPQIMLYQFLGSGTMQSNILFNVICSNKEALRLLTSPAGRKWVKFWMDDTLNYLEAIAKQ